MNIATIKKVKKMFSMKRVDDADLEIKSIKNYVLGDGSNPDPIEVSFYNAAIETQEMYVKNLKKIPSGKWGEKTQSVSFQGEVSNDDILGFDLVHGLYDVDSDVSEEDLIRAINENLTLENPHILSIVRATILFDDEEFGYAKPDMLLVSLNELKYAKPELKYKNGDIELKIDMVPNVKLATPQWGFMYPSFDGGSVDVNSMLFYTKSLKSDSDRDGLSEIFDIDLSIEGEEREQFFSLVEIVTGKKIKPKTLQRIYFHLQQELIEEEETGDVAMMGRIEIENMLKNIGYENAEISRDKYAEIMNEKKELTVSSIASKKDIKLDLGDSSSSVKINPMKVGDVKQEIKNGKKYLMIAVDEDVQIDGFEIDSTES